MQPSSVHPKSGTLRRRIALASVAGVTLVEVLVSVGILGLTSCGGIAAFTMLNQYATTLRNTSSAKALCQERIEQAMTLPFHPPLTVPSVPGALSGNGPFTILGTGANWTTASTPYTNGSIVDYAATSGGLQTSTEPVNVYVQQDGTTATIQGTRTTKVTSRKSNLSYIATSGKSMDITVPGVLFTVEVSYVYRGATKKYSMSTVRTFD